MITAINGFTTTDNMILFSKAPNILKISGFGSYTKGKLTITLTTQTKESISLTINGFTYYSGIDFEYSTSLSDLAFNICGVVPNAYQDSELTNVIYIEDVESYSLDLEGNTEYVEPSGEIKTIRVDIYQNNKYFTSLNKKVFGDSIEFKLDVLDNFALVGTLTPIKLVIWNVQTISNIYVVKGYSTDVITKGNVLLSPNITYIAQPLITLYSTAELLCTINYLDYNGTVISTDDTELDIGFNEIEVNLNCYQISLSIGGKTYLYKVCKKQTNSQHIQRIGFSNSYGGEQFIDFIGDRSTSETISNDIYNTSLYDRKEFTEKIYNKSISNSRTLTSQYVNDIDIFKELSRSYSAYETTTDGVFNPIVITAITYDEVQPNTYKVSITYDL